MTIKDINYVLAVANSLNVLNEEYLTFSVGITKRPKFNLEVSYSILAL